MKPVTSWLKYYVPCCFPERVGGDLFAAEIGPTVLQILIFLFVVGSKGLLFRSDENAGERPSANIDVGI